MRLRSTLTILLLACCASTQAAGTPAAAPDNACANAASAPASCRAAAAPIFILPAQGSAAPATSAATAAVPVVEDVPYVGLFQKSRLMKYLAWYCAVMAPIALIWLTVFTLNEYRRRRARPGAH